MKQLRCEPTAGFAGAGRADPAEIEVAGIGGIFRAGVHGEPFRSGQQHIVFKLGIKERLDVCCCTPAGRAVLGIPAKLLCVFAFEVDQQAERRRTHNAYQPVKGGKAGGKAGKGRADGLAQPQQLFPEARASGQTVRRTDFQAKPADMNRYGIFGRTYFLILSVAMRRLLCQFPLGLLFHLFLCLPELLPNRRLPGLGPFQLQTGILGKAACDGIGLPCLE